MEKKENHSINKNKPKLKKGKKLDKTFKEIIALLIWIPTIVLNFFDFDIYKWIFLDELIYDYFAKFKILILILSVILLSLIFKRKISISYIIWSVFYLLFYPFILFIKILVYLYRFFKLYKHFMLNMLKLRYQIILFLLDIVFIVLIFSLNNKELIIFCLSILPILLVCHLFYLYKLIINPLSIYDSIFNYLAKLSDSYKKRVIDEGYFQKLKKLKTNDEKEKLKKKLNKDIGSFGKMIIFVKTVIIGIYCRKYLIKNFIFIFIFTITLTILIFSVEYYGLTKINCNNFIGLDNQNFFNHLYFSFTVLSTIDSGQISPNSIISKVLVMSQFFIGIFLFYIFIISFTHIALESSNKRKTDFLNKIKNNIKMLNEIANKELNTSFAKIFYEEKDPRK